MVYLPMRAGRTPSAAAVGSFAAGCEDTALCGCLSVTRWSIIPPARRRRCSTASRHSRTLEPPLPRSAGLWRLSGVELIQATSAPRLRLPAAPRGFPRLRSRRAFARMARLAHLERDAEQRVRDQEEGQSEDRLRSRL